MARRGSRNIRPASRALAWVALAGCVGGGAAQCDVSAPANGALGAGCTGALAAGAMCSVSCDANFVCDTDPCQHVCSAGSVLTTPPVCIPDCIRPTGGIYTDGYDFSGATEVLTAREPYFAITGVTCNPGYGQVTTALSTQAATAVDTATNAFTTPDPIAAGFLLGDTVRITDGGGGSCTTLAGASPYTVTDISTTALTMTLSGANPTTPGDCLVARLAQDVGSPSESATVCSTAGGDSYLITNCDPLPACNSRRGTNPLLHPGYDLANLREDVDAYTLFREDAAGAALFSVGGISCADGWHAVNTCTGTKTSDGLDCALHPAFADPPTDTPRLGTHCPTTEGCTFGLSSVNTGGVAVVCSAGGTDYSLHGCDRNVCLVPQNAAPGRVEPTGYLSLPVCAPNTGTGAAPSWDADSVGTGHEECDDNNGDGTDDLDAVPDARWFIASNIASSCDATQTGNIYCDFPGSAECATGYNGVFGIDGTTGDDMTNEEITCPVDGGALNFGGCHLNCPFDSTSTACPDGMYCPDGPIAPSDTDRTMAAPGLVCPPGSDAAACRSNALTLPANAVYNDCGTNGACGPGTTCAGVGSVMRYHENECGLACEFGYTLDPPTAKAECDGTGNAGRLPGSIFLTAGTQCLPDSCMMQKPSYGDWGTCAPPSFVGSSRERLHTDHGEGYSSACPDENAADNTDCECFIECAAGYIGYPRETDVDPSTARQTCSAGVLSGPGPLGAGGSAGPTVVAGGARCQLAQTCVLLPAANLPANATWNTCQRPHPTIPGARALNHEEKCKIACDEGFNVSTGVGFEEITCFDGDVVNNMECQWTYPPQPEPEPPYWPEEGVPYVVYDTEGTVEIECDAADSSAFCYQVAGTGEACPDSDDINDAAKATYDAACVKTVVVYDSSNPLPSSYPDGGRNPDGGPGGNPCVFNPFEDPPAEYPGVSTWHYSVQTTT